MSGLVPLPRSHPVALWSPPSYLRFSSSPSSRNLRPTPENEGEMYSPFGTSEDSSQACGPTLLLRSTTPLSSNRKDVFEDSFGKDSSNLPVSVNVPSLAHSEPVGGLLYPTSPRPLGDGPTPVTTLPKHRTSTRVTRFWPMTEDGTFSVPRQELSPQPSRRDVTPSERRPWKKVGFYAHGT